MFIIVSGKPYRMREVPAYLYHGQHVIQQPVDVEFGSQMLIVDTGNDDLFTANYVKDRLSSGMFGTVLFDTLAEAQAYVESSKG